MKQKSTRRGFLKALGLGVCAPYLIPSSALGNNVRLPASERVTMALIGSGGQGRGDMHGFIGMQKEVRFLAVCDPVEAHREQAKNDVNNRYNNKDCKAYNDFREVLDRKDIDAVLIGTPDHWHAVITIEACKAGKDIYCEKPECLTMREGRAMADAVRKYGRVFSGGSQRVLGDYGDLPRLIWGGAIGEVKEVFVDCGGPSIDCFLEGQPTPPGVDWEMWLGPAPWRPFHQQLIRGGFRPFREYSGGGMTDWGAHRFGAAMFATQKHLTGPVEIWPGDKNDNLRRLTFKFDDGMLIHHSGVGDIRYIGSEGSLELRRGKIFGKHSKPKTFVDMPRYQWFEPWYDRGIFGDFIYSVKSRQRPFRDIEPAMRTMTLCCLGNIAYWLDRKIKWDPVKEEIIGDPEASRWLDRPKRAPWNL